MLLLFSTASELPWWSFASLEFLPSPSLLLTFRPNSTWAFLSSLFSSSVWCCSSWYHRLWLLMLFLSSTSSLSFWVVSFSALLSWTAVWSCASVLYHSLFSLLSSSVFLPKVIFNPVIAPSFSFTIGKAKTFLGFLLNFFILNLFSTLSLIYKQTHILYVGKSFITK